MIIFKTTNLINGKIYIGKTTTNNVNYSGSGNLIRAAIKKYRRHNFIRETLEICETEEQLNMQEIFWISKLNARNSKIGYNIDKGGRGAPKNCNKGKKREYSKIKRKPKLIVTKETREKQRQAKLKNPTKYWLGKKREDVSLRNKTNNPMFKLENRVKVSNSLKGKIAWNKGKRGLWERIPIVQRNLDNIIIREWEGPGQVHEFDPSFSARQIKRCCNGDIQTHKKFIWQYK